MNEKDGKRFRYLLNKWWDGNGFTEDEAYEYGRLSTGNPNFPSNPDTYESY